MDTFFFRGGAKVNHLVQQAAQQLLSQKNNLKVQKNSEFGIWYLVFVNTFGKQLIEQYNYLFFCNEKKVFKISYVENFLLLFQITTDNVI